MKLYIYREDPFRLFIDHDRDLFGDEMAEDYGVDVPAELIERFLAAEKEWQAVQDELEKLKATEGYPNDPG